MGLQTVFPALLPSSSSPLIQVFNRGKKKKGVCANVCMWRSENNITELSWFSLTLPWVLSSNSGHQACFAASAIPTEASCWSVIQPQFSLWHHRGRHQHFKGSWEQRAAADHHDHHDHHDPMYSFLGVWQLSVEGPWGTGAQ